MLLISFLYPLMTIAQFSDDFSDGDFKTNPSWIGDTARFIINTDMELQLNAPAIADTAYLSVINSSIDNTEWRFFLKLSFAPSSNNLVKIYLVADQPGLKDTLNGYFIRIGENGSNDAIELYEQTGAVENLVIRGTDGLMADSVDANIKVTRDTIGNWNLYVDTLAGTNFMWDGAGFNNIHDTTNYFGVFCQYTSTRSDKFFFDDFYVGPIMIDTLPPNITSLEIISQNQLDVYFDESLEKTSAENNANYFVDNGTGNPVVAIRDNADQSLVHLAFSNSFADGITSTLTVNGVQDFDSNTVQNDTAGFIYITIQPNDIIINEILFNPKPYGVDFIEIYNRSGKTLDLKDLWLANTFEDATLDDVEVITDSSYMFSPGNYLVLSENPEYVKQNYYTNNPNGFIKVDNMPSYQDYNGTVVLLKSDSNEIDRFSYDEDMHFELLDDVEGVSLERINYEEPTQNENNWHSAASTVGYATPAYKNSQFSNSVAVDEQISIDPEVFSPDDDGYNDFVNIHYKMDASGYVASVIVYDAKGRFIKQLANNELLSADDGIFTWDGVNEKGEKARIGIYIIYFETFNTKGKVMKFRKTCVLAGKLN